MKNISEFPNRFNRLLQVFFLASVARDLELRVICLQLKSGPKK